MTSDAAPEYVHARRGLLDALDTLGAHRQAVILVGAQAVYARTTSAPITTSPYTTDADLAIDPRLLKEAPPIEDVMRAGGFELRDQPGLWFKPDDVLGDAEVDLLVPDTMSGSGRRGARLPGHTNKAAMKSPGLEAVLSDHSPISIGALEPHDDRTHDLEVAGIAALLVAKAHKLGERTDSAARGGPDRTKQKDAGDVLRLLLVADESTAATLLTLSTEMIAGPATQRGAAYLRTLFGDRRGAGTRLAVDALRDDMPAERVLAICAAQIPLLTDRIG